MVNLLKDSKKSFTHGAILFSKPKDVTLKEIHQWITTTLYFDFQSTKERWLFLQSVPKFPESYQTGLGVSGFGASSKYIKSLGKYWQHEYIVKGILGKRTQDYHISSRVLENRSFSFVTQNIFEYSLTKFVGDIIQKPTPKLINIKTWNNKPIENIDELDMNESYLSDSENEDCEKNEEDFKVLPFFSTADFTGRMKHCNFIELIDFQKPDFTLRVNCDGTLSCRALINDIGEHLGCFATIKSLHLQRLGPFDYDKDAPLEKHELHTKQMKENMLVTSPRCKNYLRNIRNIYPKASQSYRIA